MTSTEDKTSTDTRSTSEKPKLDVLGIEYTVDWENKKCLPPAGSNAGEIDLSILPITEEEYAYQCLYNRKTRTPEPIKASVTKLSPDVVVLEIPPPNKLDPLGVAIEAKLPPEKYLRHFPVQENLAVREVPWDRSKIKELVDQQRDRTGKKKDGAKAKKQQRKL